MGMVGPLVNKLGGLEGGDLVLGQEPQSLAVIGGHDTLVGGCESAGLGFSIIELPGESYVLLLLLGSDDLHDRDQAWLDHGREVDALPGLVWL